MSVPEISVDELAARRVVGVSLIDVRQPSEWVSYRAPGAVLIPLAELVERIEEIPSDETVYVICEVGGRSARAVEHLRGIGIDAVNVAGGSKAWAEAGHPVESGP